MTYRHSLEMAVLGSILIKPALYPETRELLPSAAFTNPKARDLYNYMGKVETISFSMMKRIYTEDFATEDMGMADFVVQCTDGAIPDLSAAKELAKLHKKEMHIVAMEGYVQNLKVGIETKMPVLEEEQKNGDKPHEIDFSQLEMKQEMEWLIDGWLPLEGGLVLLAGEPAGGKTFLMQDLAMCLATQQSWLNMTVRKKCRVMIVDEENSRQLIAQRFVDLHACRRNGFHISDLPIKVLHGNGFCFNAKRKYQTLLHQAVLFKPDWIVLDSLVRLAAGLDENSNSDIATFFAQFVSPLRESGGNSGIILLHHLSKANQFNDGKNRYRIRGASDILAAVDVAWTLTQAGKSSMRNLEQEKNRYDKLAAPIEVTFQTQPTGGMHILGHKPFDINRPSVKSFGFEEGE